MTMNMSIPPTDEREAVAIDPFAASSAAEGERYFAPPPKKGIIPFLGRVCRNVGFAGLALVIGISTGVGYFVWYIIKGLGLFAKAIFQLSLYVLKVVFEKVAMFLIMAGVVYGGLYYVNTKYPGWQQQVFAQVQSIAGTVSEVMGWGDQIRDTMGGVSQLSENIQQLNIVLKALNESGIMSGNMAQAFQAIDNPDMAQKYMEMFNQNPQQAMQSGVVEESLFGDLTSGNQAVANDAFEVLNGLNTPESQAVLDYYMQMRGSQ